jgi:putative hydrolase of the HAD superfamily
MAMVRKINTLFIDIGGVLLSNGWDRAMRQHAVETFGLDGKEMNERHNLLIDSYETGKLTLDEYLKSVVFYRKRDFTPEEFKNYMFAQQSSYPEMIALVREVKSRYKLKVVAVNNEGRELNIYRIQKFGLADTIDFFVSSCFVRARKPEAAIYTMALDAAQARPEETVYVDDRPFFVEVAAGLGMNGIVHKGLEPTLSDLLAFISPEISM